MALNKTYYLTIPAAVTNGISTSQTPLAGGNLTITGSLAAGGVANLVIAQRVGIHSAANDSSRAFTITGTDSYGRSQSEILAGANAGTAVTVKDYLTVTRIAVDAATAGAVYAGTVGSGSSAPVILDSWVNPAIFSCFCTTTGSVNYTIEISCDDLSFPLDGLGNLSWDVNNNNPDWSPATGYNAQTGAQRGTIQGPLTMLRTTINSGTGTVKTRLVQAFVAGAY